MCIIVIDGKEMMFCPRVHPRAADVRQLLRNTYLEMSRDVAALSGGSAQVFSALCSFLLPSVCYYRTRKNTSAHHCSQGEEKGTFIF